jgi:hypothetical protein
MLVGKLIPGFDDFFIGFESIYSSFSCYNTTSYLKIILVVLMNTQVEASQESFQHDIHILQPSAYNFEARQTTAQSSIFADIDEVYVHLEYASFFG